MKRKLLTIALALMTLSINAQTWYGARLALTFNQPSNLALNEGLDSYPITLGSSNVSSVSRYQESGRGLRTTTTGISSNSVGVVESTMLRVNGINGQIASGGTISFTARYYGGESSLTYRPFLIIPNGGTSYYEGLYLGVTGSNEIRFGGGRQQGQFNSYITPFIIDNNTYHNYTLVFANSGLNSSIALYIDGEHIHTISNTFNLLFSTELPMMIAGSNISPRGACDLDIDHFYVWSQVYPASTVLQIAEATSSVHSVWHFDNNWSISEQAFNMSNILSEEHNRHVIDASVNYNVSSSSDKSGAFNNALRLTGNNGGFGQLPRFSVEKFSKVVRIEEINQVGFYFDYLGNTMTEGNSFDFDGIYPLAAISYPSSYHVLPGVIVGRNMETNNLELRVVKEDETYLQESAEVNWNEWNSIYCVLTSEESVEVYVNNVQLIEMEYPYGLPIAENSVFTMGYVGNENKFGFTSGSYDELGVTANKSSTGIFLDIEIEEQGETVSLQELTKAKGYAVYPNPSTSGVFTLQRLNDQLMNYEIVDVTGKIVESGVLNKGVHTLNISSAPSGIYFLKMASENYHDIIKLIK